MPLLLFALIALSGCSAILTRSARPSGTPVPLTIDCTVAYRSSVTVGIEREEVLTLPDDGSQQTIVFEDLVFHAQYSTGEAPPFERVLKLRVTPVGTEEEIAAQLFQFSRLALPRNQFLGEHGFTGLGYVYHPTSRAELQYRCMSR
jgi:hypothetical protein